VELDELETMVPIDIVVIEFTDGEPTGEIAPIVVDLVDKGIIRILDRSEEHTSELQSRI